MGPGWQPLSLMHRLEVLPASVPSPLLAYPITPGGLGTQLCLLSSLGH